uniref:Neurotransmitter-gated ion-channel ligand-binding domain-containing protein n=1 Tax=Parascaris equorum TaxID=6256 RepID=A0A914R879_PAREQ
MQLTRNNEREEKLEVNAWLKYTWKDSKLRWDPREYENVTDLRHPAGTIWQPDILLYNSILPIHVTEFVNFRGIDEVRADMGGNFQPFPIEESRRRPHLPKNLFV